jgi:hypothetical protein
MGMQKSKGDGLFPGVGKGPTGVIKSILDTSRTEGKAREEIFVDIVEKISCTFSSSGHVQTSQIDGAIQVQSLPLHARFCHNIHEVLALFHAPPSGCLWSLAALLALATQAAPLARLKALSDQMHTL